MKTYLLTLSICLLGFVSYSQSDHDLVKSTIQNFIDGTTFNYPDKIRSSFYPETFMFLHNNADSVWKVSADTYASWYSRRAPGTRNNRISNLVNIEVVGTVAYAKLEVTVPSFGNRYYDLFLLKKINAEWKIISKCTSAEPIPRRPEEMIPRPVKEVIMEGLNRPWSMAFITEQEALVAEKDGTILRVNLKTKERVPLEGLPTDVGRKLPIDTAMHAKGVFPPNAHGQTDSFNAGWFQVLMDPDFANNAYLYISYSAENEERASTTKVIRGQLQGNRLTQIETLFLAEPYSHGLFHYGGGMIFGPDDKLYITIGERNLFEHLNPELPLSQDITDKRGKVIRLNPDGSVPDDNPDFGPTAIKGLYALGIRAAQGLTIDPTTQKIWFSEHGTIQGDELNIIRPGVNYGWPYITTGGYRTRNYNPGIPEGLSFMEPVFFWDKTVAPTGLTFYNGFEFPQWKGNLFVPGLSKGSLWRMIIEGDRVVSAEELFINDRVRLRKVVQSPRGQLYLLTDEADGRIIRLKNENR